MRVLDLFSGIGGFSLGLERAGMRTVAFCEINAWCQQRLKAHWPDVPIYNDVRTLTGEQLRQDGIAVDVISGGFPCQDVSWAHPGSGLDGERSGLWFEFHRIIGEVQPHFAVVENVGNLRSRGLREILRSLAAIGFDAEWGIISAADVGAPHQRDRFFIIASRSWEPVVCAADCDACDGCGEPWCWRCQAHYADCDCVGPSSDGWRISDESWGLVAYPDGAGREEQRRTIPVRPEQLTPELPCRWETEPPVLRVVHGFPGRVDSVRALGNAVVPAIPEMIGRAIMRSSTYVE